MKSHVKQWGNSLAIRLPKTATDALNLQDGSEIMVELTETAIILTPQAPPTTLEQLLSHVTPANLHPPVHPERQP